MKTSFEVLKNSFYNKKELSKKELFALFNDVGVPPELCWRTIYRVIFDTKMNAGSHLDQKIITTQLEPIMITALENAQKEIFTEDSLFALIKDYNDIYFSIYNTQLTDVLNEMDNLTSEFKSIHLKKQKKVKELEAETVFAIESDLSIEEKVKLIKSKFKVTVTQFKHDLAKLDKITNIDHLTGLYNRRFFDDRLKIELVQSMKEKTWLNLLMIDIDNFKQFNDSYGHLIGDQALKIVAKNIRIVCNDESNRLGLCFFPARYGGEEFTVIMPAVDKKYALIIAEMIRKSICSYNFVTRDQTGKINHNDLKLTVSIGLATLNHLDGEQQSIKTLIKKADKAMFEAKAAGKNCTKISAE
jgi:diguanylate cyclase